MIRTHPRRSLWLAVALATGIALVAGATPSSAKRFTINGEGWGHGIGMSQYGAFGLAKRGWGATRILKHYYSGTRVKEQAPPKAAFRVGLLQGRPSITATVTAGAATIQLASGTVIDTPPAGKKRTITVNANQRYVVTKGNGQQIGGVWGGPGDAVEVRPAENGVVHVPEWGKDAGRGFLSFPAAGPGAGHLVAVLDPEEYLYGLGEVPSSWPKAALRAQAIAGRTYGYRTVIAGRGGCACDILGDTRDQAYIGLDKERGTDGDRWVAAVKATAQKVATHKGDLITTYYSSSSGGFTENIENVWTAATPAPYLQGVCDPGDYVSANPNRTWSETFGAKQLANALGRPGGMRRVTRIVVNERGVSGRVVTMTILGRRGDGSQTSSQMDGWDFRGAAGLKETRFWVNQNRDIVGKIRARYDAIKCRPGLARSNQKSLRGGAWQKFQRGRMFLAPGGTKARWLKGPVLARYLKLRGPKGKLGWARTDVKKLKRGRVWARFQRGVIVCRANGPCKVRRR